MKKIFTILAIFLSATVNLYSQKITAPASGCYHAAFTGNDTQTAFEQLAGKPIAIEMFFTGWPASKSPDFPKSQCDAIVSKGAAPHITWMPQVSGTTYPLDGIINGSWDSYIKGYAEQVKAWGKPLFIRYGHEMNGDWYTYGGAKNGGGTTTGFGDSKKADGPERFIASYIHVWNIFKQEGVENVTWIWCPNNGSSPAESWNTPDAYYPGDDYVDWVGMDGYNFGTTQSWSAWTEFIYVYNNLYQICRQHNKPIIIAEFASVENGGNKAQWITNAYKYTKSLFPMIKAITWFHIRKSESGIDTDWRINSSSAALASYQAAIADPYFIGNISTTAVEKQGSLPGSFELSPVYPNPFNPSATVNFKIKNPGHVILKVYNILGEETRILLNEYKTPGSYSVKFDAGSSISSGVYFFRLCQNGRVLLQKAVYTK